MCDSTQRMISSSSGASFDCQRQAARDLREQTGRINTIEDSRRGSAKMQETTSEKLNTTKVFVAATFAVILIILFAINVDGQQSNFQFPGVTRELASFCAARPSLPIDLASMIVHVKKNTSFNYKLYLFSADHVFQTGQIIPRSDFRIHSFPVKMKHINEFWPSSVATFQYKSADVNSLVSVSSSSFSLQQFMKPVPLDPSQSPGGKRVAKKMALVRLPEDVHGELLPGDPMRVGPKSLARASGDSLRHEAATQQQNFNRHIKFDRDDQLSSATRRVPSGVGADYEEAPQRDEQVTAPALDEKFTGDAIIPVGAYSSFHVNVTYLVRKDFDQREPQIIRIQVDANNFTVNQVQLINWQRQENSTTQLYPQNEDYNFLRHKLLRDPNTRITSINQIYEDWITRNFYTIVYVQRRLDLEPTGQHQHGPNTSNHQLVNDRLVFRGTSIALLGADQLDYSVKAAAFITEKNGLHYYLEFLTTNKFYLCAVDWSRRPFKMIDSRRFPIKATRTLLDNEELLLCPPAVCYSNQPIDEVIGYGRVSGLTEADQGAILRLLGQSFINNNRLVAGNKRQQLGGHSLVAEIGDLLPSGAIDETLPNFSADGLELTTTPPPVRHANSLNNLTASVDKLAELVRLGSTQLETKLHLRDWTWTLARKLSVVAASQARGQQQQQQSGVNNSSTGNAALAANGGIGSPVVANSTSNDETTSPGFEWRYEMARRNDIKAKQDTYGYALTGHEIDASYRVYNELYLISANHLITINYTLANETVTGSHPIGEEFYGLSSTLVDPITGAFYDRHENRIYFFKGDRYVGYDYATKKPLEDFLLQNPGVVDIREPAMGVLPNGPPLVSSLPVVGILGRQHHIDGVYHDFASDLVFIFSGMKFYTFLAAEFKAGSFRPNGNSLPPMRCINEHFLAGCHFDEAYPNPCQEEGPVEQPAPKEAGGDMADWEENKLAGENDDGVSLLKQPNFTDEQQMKLRTIAARGGLLDILMENTLVNGKSGKLIELPNGGIGNSMIGLGGEFLGSRSQDRIIIYLLIAMVALTIFVTVAMIVVLINWSKLRPDGANSVPVPQSMPGAFGNNAGTVVRKIASSRSPSSATSHHYLANQHHYHSRRSGGGGGGGTQYRRHNPYVPQYLNARSRMMGDLEADKSIGSMNVVTVTKSRRHQNDIDNSAL